MDGPRSLFGRWWNAPTRPPTSKLPALLAVLLGMLVVSGFEAIRGGGPWEELGGALRMIVGLLALAVEARYLLKPVEHPSASTAEESRWHARTLRHLYALHGKRDIEGALALFTDDVEWPDVAGGRVLNGKDEVRAYWTKQFAEIDPHVEPTAIEVERDRALVRVHQVVRALDGSLLHEGEVAHAYRFRGALVRSMELA